MFIPAVLFDIIVKKKKKLQSKDQCIKKFEPCGRTCLPDKKEKQPEIERVGMLVFFYG